MKPKYNKLTKILRATITDDDDIIEIETSILLQLLDGLDGADLAIAKALSALETNPVTGEKSAYAALKAYQNRRTLPAPDAAPTWTPCDERLPEKNRHVLLLMDYATLAHGWYQGWNRGFDAQPVFTWHFIQKVRDEKHTKVTHWRPLPALTPTDAAPGEAELGRELHYLVYEVMGALSFAKSVIKSGEPWSEECEIVVNGAIASANEHLRALALRGKDEQE